MPSWLRIVLAGWTHCVTSMGVLLASHVVGEVMVMSHEGRSSSSASIVRANVPRAKPPHTMVRTVVRIV